MTDKQFWVIAYDITDDRRRQRVAKCLAGYGTRSNYSVFECIITPAQLKKIQERLKKLVDPGSDCVLYYYLCISCVGKKAVLGREPEEIPEVIIA